MKTVVVIRLLHIAIFSIGTVTMIWAAGRYHPPMLLNLACSFFYSWKTYQMFPWVTHHVERV